MLQQTSSGSVKIISLKRNELWRRLRAIAHQIKAEHDNVQDVRVFGSIARGDHVGTSDVDVMIILAEVSDEEDPPPVIERALPFYKHFTLPIGVDLLVYTLAEIEQGNPFISHVYAESQSLLS